MSKTRHNYNVVAQLVARGPLLWSLRRLVICPHHELDFLETVMLLVEIELIR